MENIEITSMSSRGQIVIPQRIREKMGIGEGEKFIVLNTTDSIIFKKVAVPSKEALIRELESLAKEGARRAEKMGIKESDVSDIIHRFRKSKEKR